MSYGNAIIVDRLRAAELESTHSVVHDAEFGVRLLYQDPHSGAAHYLVRYPVGLGARVHRHTAAHTIVVLESRLAVNDKVIGPGAYCHFPAGEAMLHAPRKATTASSSRFSMVHTTSKLSTDRSSPLAGSASSLRGARVTARTKGPARNTDTPNWAVCTCRYRHR
jgi:hypothetical protein